MEFISETLLSKYLNADFLARIIHILLIVLVGLFIVRIIDIVVRRAFIRNASEQVRSVFHKGINYVGWSLIALAVLSELGLRLSALLGAAGVVGIAVGIASQKSLGNIISGFFLVSDKTFEVGDVVKIGTTSGLVHSLDLLSVKLRTFDNTLIRIPNDEIISKEITNITRFPIRRMDFKINVPFQSDYEKVKEGLLGVARKNPLCLDEPEPLFLLSNFGPSGLEVLLGVWFEKSNFIQVKNSVIKEIRDALNAIGVELSYPHVVLSNLPQSLGDIQ
ncbi:MAG TPA: mechanosensitive ion channel family protein [Sediminispirochaeta sp.]|nr:mechanosensitive ion channel family protein [Sediminispirochaeta sp.]